MIIGASLKMYLGARATRAWVADVAELAGRHPALRSGAVELLVLPTFPMLVPAVEALSPLGVHVGAQDLSSEDSGPFTGEVSARELAEIGCRFAEVGHAERRRLFGETDEVVSAKTAAAFRNGLTPVLCLGEPRRGSPDAAAEECVRQLRAALDHARRVELLGPAVVAYEPVWAIGAAEAADPQHILTVCGRLRAELADDDALAGSRVIYGGSAGPGLLGQLRGEVDGLFLGRSSHDPAGLEAVVEEAAAESATASPGTEGPRRL